MQKLYIVTRNDLPISYQAVQSIHAAVDYVFKYQKTLKKWHKSSNVIILLAVKNKTTLIKFIKKIRKLNVKYVAFKEPDLKNQITAVALEPSEKTQKLCKNLHTALKPPNKGGLKAKEMNELDERFRRFKQKNSP